MGAWDYGIFDDDTAYDYVDEIEASENPRELFIQYFNSANQSDYLEYSEGCSVAVAAAYIDNILNGTTYRNDNEGSEKDVNIACKRFAHIKVDDLKALAVQALLKLISANSELNELWAENKKLYPLWKSDKEQLVQRLSK